MNWSTFARDNRAVAPVIGFILILGFLVLLLAIYQAQIVPQQNAETELEHHQETRDELRSLHSAISAVGADDSPRFQSINLGTAYESRTLGINPPPPAGTIRTEQHNISITNESGTGHQKNISTQFIEYQPGYNELDIGSTWYENSVLYFDERDRGNSVGIIEDQEMVQGDNVSIIALQNEFQETDTGRVTLELYPTNDVNKSSLPEPNGSYSVTIPTRLNGTGYWESQLGNNMYENIDPVADEDHDLLNLSVDPNSTEINSVGIQLAPSGTDKSSEEESEEEHDYGKETNHFDETTDDENPPPQLEENNVTGRIDDPSNVNEEDGETSTSISDGGQGDLTVGFALPPTEESADMYKMRFIIEDTTGGGGGTYGFYLVNSDGDELLTERRVFNEDREQIFDFDDEKEIENISDNHDDIYLILDLETTNPSVSNQELVIDYFELIAE